MGFGKAKDGMVDYIKSVLKLLKEKNLLCKILGCDDAGEHVGLKALCDEFGVKLEFIPPYSPQYNGRIERMFAVVTQKAVAMIYDAGFNSKLRNKV